MTTLHIGKKRIQTVKGSDGSVIPPGALTVTSAYPTICSVSVDGANNVTITGVSAGEPTISYSAPGYAPYSQNVNVSPLPTLIITDGPEF